MNEAAAITRSLEQSPGGGWSLQPLNASGFCATWRAEGSSGALFLKAMPLAKAEVLDAEADGLAALAATGTVRVPAVAAQWRDAEAGHSVLALEWLNLRQPDAGFGARLGHALGRLHAALPASGSGCYGWHRDNMIGATPQRNRWSSSGTTAGWAGFFARERLGAMRERLAARGASAALDEAVGALIEQLPAFFADGHAPRASLIHGDLWSGNWGMLADGTPVIYDPAVSCSDAEAEIAMMELFGHPPAGFHDAYNEVQPLHAGYARRRGLYQLYHLLNHALLFGGGYLQQSLDMARALAREK
jgi:fructosamine-3-kinase